MTRILIIQLKRLGDLVLTTPLIAGLRRHVPNSHITLALDGSAHSLAGLVDHDAAVFHRRDKGRFWREIIGGNFDLVFDVTGNDRSALVSLLTRARRRVTWNRFARKPLRKLVYSDFVDSSVKNRHTADHHTDLLQAIGVEPESTPSHLSIPASAGDEAGTVLAKSYISGPYAIIHPGTARPEKYWLPDRWSAVANWLRDAAGLPVVITGSNDIAERSHIDQIDADVVDLAGKLPLPVSAAVIANARVICAVDSLPVHLADALGTPVVALFGPTNPFHWRPRRSTSRVVTPVGTDTFRPEHPKLPMSEISVDAVIAALRDVI